MIKAETKPGKDYALREKRSSGVALQRAETIEGRIGRSLGADAREQGG